MRKMKNGKQQAEFITTNQVNKVIDGLLDEYNFYMEQFSILGDEKFKRKAESIMKSLNDGTFMKEVNN